jgi:hypothetical protein
MKVILSRFESTLNSRGWDIVATSGRFRREGRQLGSNSGRH